MNEGVPQNSAEKVYDLCRQFEINVVNDSADLTHLSLEQVESFLNALSESGVAVLHGSNSEEVYKCLETRQGHCLVKESGRKKAVYATPTAKIAISRAVVNKKYLRSKSGDFISSFSMKGDKITFGFTPNIYKLFEAHDPNVFSDGYVYVLDKANFVNAPDAEDEWHSETDQTPLLACKVSKKLGEDLYITGTDHDTVSQDDFGQEEFKQS